MKRKANALSLCLAAALLLGLSQCKKQETPITPPTPEETEEGIHITLDVEDGSRHVVIPGTNTAVVNYSFGDKIYVGDGSKYIGTLTNTGSTGGTGSHFEGTILSPSASTQRLHFYFIGGLSPLDDDNQPLDGLSVGETSFKIDISDQSSNLPVLSYGNAPYTVGATSYTCMLKNMCALVKVGLLLNTESTVKLINSATINIKTEASISFDHGIPTIPYDDFFNSIKPFAAGSATKDITLYSESGTAKWAILLPHISEVTTSVKIGDKLYNNVKVPVIAENSYGSITYDACVPSSNFIYNCDYGVFSVNGDKLVTFSKGNLQYQASPTPTWRFAPNQWNFVGNNDNNNTMSATSGNWIDLFGWGTWGSNGNPLNISTDLEDYTWSEFTNTLDDHNDWRTLSYDEWYYLLHERQSSYLAMVKCAWATVNGVLGIVLLPDNWDNTIIVSNINGEFNNVFSYIQFGEDAQSNYNYSGDQWTAMKKAGAVFLPAAGNRTVTTETTTEGEPPTTTIKINEAGNKGYYWTSTTNSHKFVGFDISGVSTSNTTDDPNPTFGCAVRLVRDIE